MEPAHEARAPLLERILADGLLFRSATQPIVVPDGSQPRWMLDSLGVSMSTEGARLAAACLLEKLKRFEGRQLATYGTIGIPLMQSCITASNGRHWGLLVRKERKGHGSLKLIEGKIDPLEPVVLVDDSISSGRTTRAAHQALTEAGLHVEGAVCLVRFGYDGAALLEEELGLRIESVFEVWHDVMPRIPGELDWTGNPTRRPEEFPVGPHAAPEGLHPSMLARAAMREYLKSGKLLRAPRTLDRRYDARGGTWVSLRRKSNVDERPARHGFWCFPEEAPGLAPRDVVLASALTARELAKKHSRAREVLEECSAAVTFFTPLERTTPGGLDNARYGIVARSLDRTWVMGGALPNMPGMANEQQQLRHARSTNAKLYRLERHVLYRHELTKVVEPGAEWQPFGTAVERVPYEEDEQAVAPFLRAAYARVLGRPTPVPALPSRVERFYLSLYVDGELKGCQGGRDLDTLARAVWSDGRFGAAGSGEVAIVVSFLTGSERWGEASPESVVAPLRVGHDGLAVEQGERYGFLLPHVAMMQDLSPRGFVDAVIDKAGITRAPYRWTKHPVTSWVVDSEGVRRLRDGLPEGKPSSLKELLPLVRDFVVRNHAPRGGINVGYFPFLDEQQYGVFPEWTAHGAWVKARAGLKGLALDDLKRLKLRNASTATLAFALLARKALRQSDGGLTKQLLARVDRHGRIDTGEDAAAQDWFPGQALLALGREAPARAFAYYRRRFRQNRAWGAVPWLSLAFSQVGDDFAFELADFALEQQSQKTGAFLNDFEVDAAGALSWVSLEGLSGPLALARKRKDAARARRYAKACEKGLSFCDRLVYQPRDAAVLPNAGWAFGGVRCSLMSSEVRIDFVHHALSAMLLLRGLW
jgi:orotate phosphoribosyltransferase